MVWVLIGTLMIVGSINFALRGIMYAQIEEMKVPVRSDRYRYGDHGHCGILSGNVYPCVIRVLA
ncbi:putative membrane protein [Salmonella enterica subsp. enterica]|nr:putative membrane protein [Salmonella enterica subsp. enterica]